MESEKRFTGLNNFEVDTSARGRYPRRTMNAPRNSWWFRRN
jgi:hypothetical protein